MSTRRFKPTGVTVVTTCPHCGESVEIVITKKELKAMLKGFKLPVREAQLYGEKEIEKIRKAER